MIRIVLVLVAVALILYGIGWGYQWLVKNRVRFTMTRPPTSREIFLISMVMQVLRTLFRLLIRR